MTNTDLDPLIIIGTGLAGYNLAKEWRKLNTTTPLILVTQDDGHFYSKPQLSTAFSQAKSASSLIISSCDHMASQLQATILSHSSVTDIDVLAQKVQCNTPSGAQTLPYSQLVFAIGALPKPLPLFARLNNHFRINNLQEYATFRSKLSDFEHLTIIGSGLVACEFAHDLSHTPIKMSVITPDPYPLHGLVPNKVGHALQEVLARTGIYWYNQSQVLSACQRNTDLILSLSSGIELQTNAILCAIGLVPNIELAQKIDLHTHHGIVVDPFLRTNKPHIFALGDCAQIQGRCRFYVAPLLQSARSLAHTLCGILQAVSFPPTPISLKVHSYPIIVYPPAPEICGAWSLEHIDNNIKGLYYDENKNLQGFVLSGNQVAFRQEYLQEIIFSSQKKVPSTV